VNAGVRRPRRRVDGVLLLDKPTGLSSNAALQRAKRAFDAEKAGHTGTLDPLASGLLPLCFGEATKFAQYLLDAGKTYVATLRFGIETSTGDAEGDVTATSDLAVTPPDLAAVLPRFTGRIAQVPPRHAALKFEGRAYYDYARKGIEIPRVARDVVVDTLVITDFAPPFATLTLTCSKGTYVRVLAEDIGRALGCGAHLTALRRTATGGFGIAETVTLEALEALPLAARDALLLSMSVLVGDLPRLALDPLAGARFRQGMAVPAGGVAPGACAVFEGDRLLGVATSDGALAAPRRVVADLSGSGGGAAAPFLMSA